MVDLVKKLTGQHLSRMKLGRRARLGECCEEEGWNQSSDQPEGEGAGDGSYHANNGITTSQSINRYMA